jgi:DNA-binding HxlR family transcriptional regulator
VASSVARATDLFGDAWTALIMRDVQAGATRSTSSLRTSVIRAKILAARLSRLVEEDALARERYQERPVSSTARPTRDPVQLALMT